MKISQQLILNLIKVWFLGGVGLFSLTACSSMLSSRVPDDDSLSMSQVYSQELSGEHVEKAANIDGSPESSLKNSLLNSTVNYSPFTRSQKNEINNLFPRLPNPDVVMYIFPHLSGEGNNHVPVPGYSTVFPLYENPHYLEP